MPIGSGEQIVELHHQGLKAMAVIAVKSTLQWLNVGLRAVMEGGIVAGLAFWGYHAAAGVGGVLLGIAAPVVGFGVWSLVDFRDAGTFAEPLRLSQELIISGLAALALYVTGQPGLGLALAAASIVHHAAVYLLGGRLLKQQEP